jgi:DNA-binding transcriptional LysR family regulator
MKTVNTQRRTELGLLAVLVAIADTGSVSGAAERLSLSQPAVSHALKRLRDIVGDHLFRQSGRRMEPTAVAMQMIEDARQVIDAANVLLSPRVFEPTTGTPGWKIGVSDYALSAFGLTLLTRIKAINPRARVEFVPVGPQTLDDLLSARLDFAFWGDIGDRRITPPLMFRELFLEHYVGVMSRTHPLAGLAQEQTLTLGDWLSCDHIRFANATPGASAIDRALVKLGRTRTFGLTSSSHRMNLDIAKHSTMLLSIPSRLIQLVDTRDFITFPLPIAVPPYPYYLLHHSRL